MTEQYAIVKHLVIGIVVVALLIVAWTLAQGIGESFGAGIREVIAR